MTPCVAVACTTGSTSRIPTRAAEILAPDRPSGQRGTDPLGDRFRRARSRTSTSTSRREWPRPSTGCPPSTVLGASELARTDIMLTLGAITKTPDDRDAVAGELDALGYREAADERGMTAPPRRLIVQPDCPLTDLRSRAVRGVDRAAFAVSLSARLQQAGVSVGFTGMGALGACHGVVPPDSRPALYWAARICLVQRQSDLASFDAVFAAIFDESGLGLDPHARRRPVSRRRRRRGHAGVDRRVGPHSEEEGGGLPWATLPRVTSTPGESRVSLAVPERLPSELEGLADTPFDELDPAQLALLERLARVGAGGLADPANTAPVRSPRRTHARPCAPTLARARRTGWEPIELVRTRPVRKQPSRGDALRRQSIDAELRRGVPSPDARRGADHGRRGVRIRHDIDATHLRAGLQVAATGDRNRRPRRWPTGSVAHASRPTSAPLLASRHGGAIRGAIVIIASDGWDSDPPDELAKVMARLHRRAYQVLWLNPRAAAPGFAPLVGAMSAALPYCDHVLPAHNIRALADVVERHRARRPVGRRQLQRVT